MQKTGFALFGLILLSLLMSFSGCSNKKTGPVPKNKYVIGFSQIGSESEWRIANTQEIQEAYSNHPRVELIYSNAGQRRDNQITAMRGFINQKVDAIIFVPIVATGWDAILTEAKEAGIPVIIINRAARMVSGNIEDFTVCIVAPDNVFAGELLARTFIDSFSGETGPMYIVEMKGTEGASSAVDRGRGIHNILDNNRKMIIRYSQTGDYTRSTARHVMEFIINNARDEGIKISGVISHSDDMAIGAMEALLEAGMNPGTDVKIVGIDGIRDAFIAMTQGRYTATVENPLGYGDKTIEILLDLLDNGKKPADYWVVLKNSVYTEKEAAIALPYRRY